MSTTSSNGTATSTAGSTVDDFRRLPPLTVTFAELRAILLPIVRGDKWAENTIHDLWTMGAPTPKSKPGTPTERRIIFPGKLAEWLSDVLTRQGKPLDAAAQAYIDLQKLS